MGMLKKGCMPSLPMCPKHMTKSGGLVFTRSYILMGLEGKCGSSSSSGWMVQQRRLSGMGSWDLKSPWKKVLGKGVYYHLSYIVCLSAPLHRPGLWGWVSHRCQWAWRAWRQSSLVKASSHRLVKECGGCTPPPPRTLGEFGTTPRRREWQHPCLWMTPPY